MEKLVVVDECDEEEMMTEEWKVTDEWNEDDTSASAGKSLIHILLQFNKNTLLRMHVVNEC